MDEAGFREHVAAGRMWHGQHLRAAGVDVEAQVERSETEKEFGFSATSGPDSALKTLGVPDDLGQVSFRTAVGQRGEVDWGPGDHAK